jgi:sugar diacid utilization regulator
MTKQELRISIELANHGLSGRKAAQSLNYHHNTVYYHVKNIRKTTGLDPYDFFDMQFLYPMALEVAQHEAS